MAHNTVGGVDTPGDHTGSTGVIPNTLADAKGDLIAATAADTWAKVTAGANETQLVADSGQAAGVKWYGRYRTLNVNTTAVGNVGTGEDDLITYTVPAAALAANGDHLEFEAAGTFAATANNKRVKVKFGAATILDTGVLAITAAGDWQLRGKIIRTGAATQKCAVLFTSTDAALRVLPDYATAAETLSGTVVLKLTGEATANDDIVAELMVTSFQPV